MIMNFWLEFLRLDMLAELYILKLSPRLGRHTSQKKKTRKKKGRKGKKKDRNV